MFIKFRFSIANGILTFNNSKMAIQHTFKLNLNWEKQETKIENGQRVYPKSHQIKINQKEILKVSAAKAFKGDPTLYNPEDLLLSSLCSCHMMSYLYVCQINKIDILSYVDDAEAILEVFPDGSGKITSVTLRPIIKIRDASQIDLAVSLHDKAHELCFIANSCNFPVKYYPQIEGS